MIDRRRALPLGLAGTLGVGAALLVACGGSSALIPPGNAGQLTGDFDAVAAAVANGSCKQDLQKALIQTRRDLAALPATLDPRLASALQSGVNALSSRAHGDCKQQTTTTATNTNTDTTPTNTTQTNTHTNPPPTTTTDTNTTTTQSTTTDTNPTNPTTATGPTTTGTTTGVVPDNGGGTPAPNGQSGRVSKPGTGDAAGAGAGGASGNGGGN